MRRTTRRLAPLAALLLSAAAAAAQQTPDRWRFDVEVGGSVFFGNRPQSQFTTKTEITSAHAPLESSTRLEFTYGEAEDRNGETVVSRRSWLAANTIDLRPGARWRPFVSAGAERSFERKIDMRFESGMGVKLDHASDRENRIEASLALLGERTYPREVDGLPTEISTLARWSSSARVRRTLFQRRLSLDLRGEYKPVFDAFGNYTWTTQNAFTLGITQVVSLRLNTKLQYDSRAVDRGAKTNRDGQVQLALAARF